MRRTICLGLLCTVATLGVAARAAAPDPATLLQTYEPVLLFHPGEDWAPKQVESYLNVAKIERETSKGVWTTVPPPIPTSTAGCARTPCFRLNLPCKLHDGYACYARFAGQTTDWAHPVVYGTIAVVPPTAKPPPGFTTPPRYLVHYWLFYAFDDWHSAHDRLWQTHEGDWESITVGVGSDGTPQLAAYSEHCSGTVRPWASVTKRGGTHPVAYVALGSHANWFTRASSVTRFTECLKGVSSSSSVVQRLVQLTQDQVVDRMGTAHPLGPAGLSGVTPLTLTQLEPATTDWARFAGRWGEGQIVWLGSKPHSFLTASQGYGPGTPNWFATTVGASWHPATG
jgi:hypothetical protein